MNIALDLDGVVYDWHIAVYDYLIGTGQVDVDFDYFWTDWIHNLPKCEQDYIVSIPFLYENILISDENLCILNKLSINNNLYYITARDNSLRLITERWLRKNKIPQDFNLIMSKDKVNYIKLLSIDYFVDDFISQIENTKNFCNVFLFARPWNKEKQNILPTVRSLKEFYNIVKDK